MTSMVVVNVRLLGSGEEEERLVPAHGAGNDRTAFFPLPSMQTNYLFRALRMMAVLLVGGVAGAVGAAMGASPATGAEIVEVKKIWDAGGHNAFTDMLRWQGRWWCTFREAAGHVGGDGVIRVIVSADGATWVSAAALAEKDVDLRDPKLSVAPDGRLMLVCGGSIYLGTKELKGRRPRVSFSKDGRSWTEP
eukprot:gene43593-59045_t